MIELICLAILLFGTWRGWRNGLLKEAISFTGFFIGLYVAYHYYKQVGCGAVGFLLLWIGIPLALGVAAWLLTKVLDKILVIGTMNRVLGAALGFLKYAFLLGCLIMAIDYVREVKTKYEANGVVKALQTAPKFLFPNVSEDECDGGEE
ncbi:MAG: CvpA family protein [Bacteroidaceae bacterium]|nr:CvpA family protein [Bacteroidaceae bacterium]